MLGYKSFVRLLSAFLLVILLAACAAAQPAASTDPVDVQVNLGDFSFEPSMTTFKVGVPYHFIIKNTGAVPHELMIMEPVDPSAVSDMEELDKMALAHAEEDDLPAGGSTTLDYTFTSPAAAGGLEFACHLPGHYEAGMKLPITVSQ